MRGAEGRPWSREQWLGYVILPLFLVLLNLGLKWPDLDTVQVGMDEPFSIFHAQKEPMGIAKELAKGNNPPLFEVILHYQMLVWGDDAAAVRVPSMLFSIGTAVLVFLLGWRAGGQVAGMVGALLFSFGKWPIYFAHEARAYALLGFLTLLVLWLLLRWQDRPSSWGRWVMWMVGNVLLMYCHYFGFIVIGLQVVWLVLVRGLFQKSVAGLGGGWSRGMWGRIAGAIVIWGAAFVPQVMWVMARPAGGGGTHWVPLANLASGYGVLAKFGNQPVVILVLLGVLAVAGGRFLWLWQQGRAKWSGAVLLVLGLFPGAYLLLFVTGMVVPVFLDRYAYFAVLGMYVLAGVASQGLWPSRQVGGAVGLGLVVAMGLTTNLRMDLRSRWREVASFVEARRVERDAVLITPRWNQLAYAYHGDREAFRKWEVFEAEMLADRRYPVMKYTALDAHLPISAASVIWTVSAGDEFPDLHASVQGLLDSAYVKEAVRDTFEGIYVERFVRKPLK